MNERKLCIGIIAPASALVDDGTEATLEKMQDAAAGMDYLQSLGHKIVLASNIQLVGRHLKTNLDKDGLGTAGTIAERVQAIEEIYANPKIDVVLALRGGYGSMQLLEHLDYALIRKAKKPLLGYSDLTALFMAFAAKSKLRSYHSPMLFELTKMTALTAASFKDLLDLLLVQKFPGLKFFEQNPVSIRLPANAKILGGNLSIIASMIGTPYLPSFKGSYVLLEDCNEPAYKVDRMLEQLRLAGIFKKCKGVLVGVPQEADFNFRVLDEICESQQIKVLKKLQIGHGPVNVSLPIN